MKKIISAVLLTAMVFPLGGCKKESGQTNVTVDPANLIDYNAYKDSEDIPSWEGETVNLSIWQDASSPNAYQTKQLPSKDDIVTKELERITGIHFDTNESFDNGGNSFDSKISQIIATGNFPSAVHRMPNLNELIKIDALWDLSEYIKTYAPTVYKLYGPDSKSAGVEWQRQMDNYGGVYSITLGSPITLRDSVKQDGFYDISDERLAWRLGYGHSENPYIYVRDDILKQIYPEAHSAAELKAIYEKNGGFTEEEIFDVPWNEPQDVIDFLYKVRDQLKANGENDTYAFYTHCGADNWPVLTVFGSMLKYGGNGYGANYFSYYDREDDELKFTFKEDWFKEVLALHNKLIRDGVASQEALIDTNAVFKEKINQGKYAVTYNEYLPTSNEVGDDVVYRKVYAKYKVASDKFLSTETLALADNGWSFFKKGISEKDLIQTIRAMEFSVSNPGQKLIFWGTKSAGLYTEDADGNLKYNDEKLADYMVFNTRTDNDVDYGLSIGPWPGRFFPEASVYHPQLFYNTFSKWENEFDAAKYHPLELIKSNQPNVYTSAVTAAIPKADDFWKARQTFEDALVLCFASSNDEEFEKNYNNMIALAEENGLTEETRKEFDKFYKEVYNKDFMQFIRDAK